jgi:mercuric ion binding protein
MRPVRIIIMLIALLAQPALAAERSTTFSIANMSCALCPITVKSAIAQAPGVISVEVDADLGRAIVRYEDEHATTAAIAAASTNAGYPPPRSDRNDNADVDDHLPLMRASKDRDHA